MERLSAGDETCTQALFKFREKAITLLFLERDALRHYPENDRQVCGVKVKSFSYGSSSKKITQFVSPLRCSIPRKGKGTYVVRFRMYTCGTSRPIEGHQVLHFVLSIALYHVHTQLFWNLASHVHHVGEQLVLTIRFSGIRCPSWRVATLANPGCLARLLPCR